MRRKAWAPALLVAAGAIGLAFGIPAWQDRRLDAGVDRALAELALREAPPLDQELLRKLDGKPQYTRERRLFRGVQLLRGGDPGAALNAFAAVKPEGRLRLPL